MAKKSTRGKIRDRVDYSDLLGDIKNSEKTILIEENTSCGEKDNPPKEKRKDYWRMRSDEKVLFFYQKSTNKIHDKHCDITKKIPLKDLMVGVKFLSKKEPC